MRPRRLLTALLACLAGCAAPPRPAATAPATAPKPFLSAEDVSPLDARTGDVSLDRADPVAAVTSLADAVVDIAWDARGLAEVRAELAQAAKADPAKKPPPRLILSNVKASTAVGIVLHEFRYGGLAAWPSGGHIVIGKADAPVLADRVRLRAYDLSDLARDYARWREAAERAAQAAGGRPSDDPPGADVVARAFTAHVNWRDGPTAAAPCAVAAGDTVIAAALTLEEHQSLAALLEACRGTGPARIPHERGDLIDRILIDGTTAGVRHFDDPAPAKRYDAARLDDVLADLTAATGVSVCALGATHDETLTVDLRGRTAGQAVDAIVAALGAAPDAEPMTWRAYDNVVFLLAKGHAARSWAVEVFDVGDLALRVAAREKHADWAMDFIVRDLQQAPDTGEWRGNSPGGVSVIGTRLIVTQRLEDLDGVRRYFARLRE